MVVNTSQDTLPLAFALATGQSLPTVTPIYATVLWCLLFTGLAIWKFQSEEILYRGYIQSRLNQAFDTPWRFLGVDWSWGIVITSFLFGLSHILNGLDLDAGTFNPQ
jgi:membrane protease YdiL (CAAX protease family)